MRVNPTDEYRQRLADRRARKASLDRVDARLAHARMATFAAAVILAVLALLGHVTFWLLPVPLVIFAALARRHDGVIRERDAADRAATLYERGLARIADRWQGSGESGARFLDDRHLYARDLDLFGPGSLFALLSLARTRRGEEVLAAWLTRPAAPDDLRQRQAAIAELSPALDLRETMWLAGGDVRAAVETERLLSWAEAPSPTPKRFQTFVVVLTAIAAGAVGHWLLTAQLYVLIPVVVIEFLCAHVLRRQIESVLHGAEEPPPDFVADVLSHRARDLDALAGLLRCLERPAFASPRLQRLRAALGANGSFASQAIRHLHRLAEWHDWERSVHLVPLALLLMGQIGPALVAAAVLLLWKPQVAAAVERWRARHGAGVRRWIDVAAECEALMSLAGYSYEHPDDVFPELVEESTPADPARPQAFFDAEGLGHPLLPSATMVRNDVQLTGDVRLFVVSGSNMSGKSTLLRTVGINAVLASAGAPVRARALRLSPLAIGATLRIQDSLQEGRSRFYAEVTRIRELVDTAKGPVPLLFLLDELFHGTNSHDRLVGAAGVLRSLLELGAIGLVTTHDLALTAIVDELSPRAINVHFEEWFEGGEMRFDYRLKPGAVQRSNALALMRAVGLDVGA